MLFSKKIPEIKENWSVLTSEHNSKQMIIRRNNGISIIAGKGYLNLRSGISYKFLIQTDDGIHSNEEDSKIYEIEDKIYEYFDNNKNSVVSLIITTNGFKEYAIYHNKENNFNEYLNNLRNQFIDYNLTSYTKEDKNWELYTQFVDASNIR